MKRVGDIRGAIWPLVALGAGLLSVGCVSSKLPVSKGQAADPNAEIREQPPAPNALAKDFDPFSSYPELQGEGGGEHHHHHAEETR